MCKFKSNRYAATAITETVRQELQFLDETVKVTAVTPGLVESDIVYVSFLNNCPSLVYLNLIKF
jgi:NADP-dependent 3-hydroxy acid dehydrogenase YdfG